MALTLKRLDALFEESTTRLGGTIPIRKTQVGIWVPSPVSVTAAAAELLDDMGVLADADVIVDAGSGDGRVAAVLALLRPSAQVYGIEADPIFHAQAVENLAELERRGLPPHRVHLVEGDYCEPRTYTKAGIEPSEVTLFLNYPDGHHEALARFIAEYGRVDARLCVVTHDHSLEVDTLSLRQQGEMPVDIGPDWLVSVYQGRR